MKALTQERLKELMHYDRFTGHFTWIKTTNLGGRVKVGSRAGCETVSTGGKAYVCVQVDCRRHLAHRLAFLYVTGSLPADQVDHGDGDGTNNAWSNLRAVTNAENSRNVKLRSDNSSGCPGVHWRSDSNRWRASIYVGRLRVSLGNFVHLDEAVAARRAAETTYGFHKNHGAVRPL